MENQPPYTLSEKEFGFFRDTDFLLTKVEITAKIINLLEHAQDRLKETILRNNYLFPEGTDTEKGKISRGEFYKKLPWIILDFPKQFSNQNIFTFRTLFRWGNEFSCTLHLQHAAFSEKKEKILSSIHSLKGKEVFFCVNTSPWEYHYDSSNYLPLDNMEPDILEKAIREKSFIKLSRKLPLEKYQDLSAFSGESLSIMMEIL